MTVWDRVRGLWMEQALDTGASLSLNVSSLISLSVCDCVRTVGVWVGRTCVRGELIKDTHHCGLTTHAYAVCGVDRPRACSVEVEAKGDGARALSRLYSD